jgi:hypothetical protein
MFNGQAAKNDDVLQALYVFNAILNTSTCDNGQDDRISKYIQAKACPGPPNWAQDSVQIWFRWYSSRHNGHKFTCATIRYNNKLIGRQPRLYPFTNMAIVIRDANWRSSRAQVDSVIVGAFLWKAEETKNLSPFVK